jgi:hypothetical protein
MGEERLYIFVAVVEKLDEDQDTIVGNIGGAAKLFDLSFRKGVIRALGMEGQD